MATYDLLSEEEKRNIIVSRLRSLENILFSAEIELLEESSVTTPDSVRISNIQARVASNSEKIAALKVELQKYPESVAVEQ